MFFLQAKGANRKLKLEKEKIEGLSKEVAVSYFVYYFFYWYGENLPFSAKYIVENKGNTFTDTHKLILTMA